MAKTASWFGICMGSIGRQQLYGGGPGAQHQASPMIQNEEIDVTTHDSTGGYREFIAAPLKDGGEVTLELAWDPDNATHDEVTGLMSGAISADTASFKVTFPSGTYVTFSGFVKSFEPGELDTENEMTASVTIRVSGALTWV